MDAQRPSENPGVSVLTSPSSPGQIPELTRRHLILTSSLPARTHLPAHSPLSNLAQTGTCTPHMDSSVMSHPGQNSAKVALGATAGNKESQNCLCVGQGVGVF